jgi:hypothetical protein
MLEMVLRGERLKRLSLHCTQMHKGGHYLVYRGEPGSKALHTITRRGIILLGF